MAVVFGWVVLCLPLDCKVGRLYRGGPFSRQGVAVTVDLVSPFRGVLLFWCRACALCVVVTLPSCTVGRSCTVPLIVDSDWERTSGYGVMSGVAHTLFAEVDLGGSSEDCTLYVFLPTELYSVG